MRLKIVCWAFAALTVLLLLSWPSMVGLPRRNASRTELKAYVVKAQWYFGGIVLSFLGTTVFAALVVRQLRREVREESAANLRALIEGTLHDHRRKSGSDQDEP